VDIEGSNWASGAETEYASLEGNDKDGMGYGRPP